MNNEIKTLIIYDQCGQEEIKFYVVQGDYTHLDGIYINSMQDEGLVEELVNLFYDCETGQDLLTPEDSFPLKAVKDGALVIVAGFLP